MRRSKRIFDFTMALAGLVFLSPFFLFIALFILLFDRGSILFLQRRVGLNGVPFTLYKFRTMKRVKEGRLLTVGDDQRITWVGRLLRKWKIDEFPQLFNVLKGEMSFVGPRPEVAKYVEFYTSEQREVLNLIPGITDLASIKYRNESEILAQASEPEKYYIETILPDKIHINLQYAQKANLLSDLGIILKTLCAL